MGTKDKEIEDLLGDGKKADKPAKAEKAAKAEKPAKKEAKAEKAEKPAKAAKKEAKAEKPAKADKKAKGEKPAKEAPWDKAKGKGKDAGEEKPKRQREPIEFEEGEREAIAKKVTKALGKVDKKGINTKELSAKVDVPTRKLRAVLYSMERAGECKLKPGESRAAGMTVCPA